MTVSHFYGFAKGIPESHSHDSFGIGVTFVIILFNSLDFKLISLADNLLFSSCTFKVSFHFVALLGSLDVFIINDNTGFVNRFFMILFVFTICL